MATIKKTIITTSKQRGGTGKPCFPIRQITEVFSLAGEKIGESDPLGLFSIEDMTSFGSYCLCGHADQMPIHVAVLEWQKKLRTPYETNDN